MKLQYNIINFIYNKLKITHFLFGSFLLKSNLSDNTVNATLQILWSSVRRAICVGPTTICFTGTFNPLNAGNVTNPYLLIFSATSFNLKEFKTQNIVELIIYVCVRARACVYVYTVQNIFF